MSALDLHMDTYKQVCVRAPYTFPWVAQHRAWILSSGEEGAGAPCPCATASAYITS